ncbi:MAG: TolC family protein [Woeseiaceae bacterium]
MVTLIFGQFKKYKRILYTIASFVLLLQSSQGMTQELGLDSFVSSILNNNPGVQKILSEKNIAESARDASLGINDGTLVSSLNSSHSEPNNIFGIEPNESDSLNLNLSYNRIFSDTGTRLTLGYSNLYTDRNPAAVTAGTKYYQPSFTVKLTQPLLKNAGGIQDSLNIKLSQLDFEISKLSSQENLESYITQLSSLYVDWYLSSRELKIATEVHQKSIQQEKLTRTKVKRQVSEPYELLRAQEIREDYFSRLQQAQGRYTGLTHQIKYQMNPSQQSSNKIIQPVNPQDSTILSLSNNNHREDNYLGTISRLKDILDKTNKQQIIILQAKTNATSSDLNLTVGYTQHNVGDVYDTSTNKNDYSVMLEYKYVLGNRSAEGAFQVQQAKKHQIEADTKQRLIDAKANLANLKALSSQLKMAIKSVERKLILGNKKIKKEQYLYRIGKLDLFELLRDQTSHMESRLNKEKLFSQQLSLQLKIGELLDTNLENYNNLLTNNITAVK